MSLLLRVGRIALTRRLSRLPHRLPGLEGRLQGLVEGPARAKVLSRLLDPFHQGVGTTGELPLPRRGGGIGPRRLRGVPVPLPALQVLRIGRQSGQLPLDSCAAEELVTPLQGVFQLVLGLGQMLERLAGGDRKSTRLNSSHPSSSYAV